MNQKKILGYLFGMLTALCWAISPLFILKALRGLPSPIWGTAIGLSVATLIYGTWYLWQRKWTEIQQPIGRGVYWQIFGGLVAGLGILSRNIALETTRVAIVVALAQTASLFTLILAPFLLGRNLAERVTPKLVAGVFLIIAGSILIIVGRNY
jgi:drug/metabolite transporter (DMT)-like permease